MTERLIGVVIEGWGLDSTYSGGTAWYHGVQSQPATTDYQWISALSEPLGTLRVSVNPFNGEWTAPGLSFALDASDRIATALMYEEAYPTTALSAAITAATTTIPTSGITGLAGEVIWIGDEAILLGTVSGASYINCTRAYYSTPAQSHAADDFVFTAQPVWYRRKVIVVEHDVSTATERVLWQGLIRDISMDGPSISVDADSLLAAARRARLNTNARNLNSGTIKLIGRTLNNQLPTRATASVRTSAGLGYYIRCYQVGEDGSLGASVHSTTAEYVPIPDGGMLDTPIVSLAEQFDGPVYEVFAVDRAYDAKIGAGVSFSSTGDLTYPYHPVAVSLALLTSTGEGTNGAYDVLGKDWGLGIDYLDFASFTDAIASRPDEMIDQLALGTDGEQVDAFEVIERTLLAPFGYFLTFSATGELALGRLGLPDLDASVELSTRQVTAYPDYSAPLVQDRALGQRATSIVAEVGGSPFRDPQTVTIRGVDRSTRAGRMQDGPRLTYDFSAIKAANIINEGRDTDSLSNALVQIIALGIDGAPRLRLRCASWRFSSSDPIAPGLWVGVDDLSVESAWWVDGDGQRVLLDGSDVRGAGLVIGITQPLSDAWMELDLLMIGWRLPGYIRVRAPAGVVDAWDGGTFELDLEADNFNTPSAHDASAFAVGDEVALWSVDGVQQSTTYPSVTGISVDTLTLSGGFGAATPAAGDILRVAPSTTFDNTSRYSGVKRPFAYMGDAAGEFDDVDANTVSDAYGTELFAGTGGTAPTNETFNSLDDDAVNEAAGVAQPLDTWLEHVMRERESWLLRQGSQCSQPMLTHHGGDYSSYLQIRPYCSASRTTICYLPWLTTAALSQIDVAGTYRVATESGVGADQTSAQVTWTLEVRGTDGTVLGDATDTLTSTMAATPVWQDSSLQADLTLPVTTPGIAQVALWAISSQSAEPATSSATYTIGTDVPTLGAEGWRAWCTDPSTMFTDTAATRPNSSGLDTQALGTGGIDEELLDLLYTELFAATRYYAYTSGIIPPAFSLQLYDLAYLQLRGLDWRVRYDDTNPQPDDLIRPEVTVLGEVETQHATRTDRAYLRPRLSWVGPRGTQGNADFPTGYTERWSRTTHDAAATTLESAHVYIATDAPKITVLVNVMPTWVVNRTSPVPESLESEVAAAAWDITVEMEQLSGTSWGVQGSVTQEVELIHWLTYRRQQGVLASEWAVYDGTFPFKEGQMFDKDLPFVQTIAVTLSLPGFDASANTRPVRINLTAEGTGTPTFGSGVEAASASDTRLQLAIVGMTIWEVPQ